MITINNLSKRYGERLLFEKLNVGISQGEKIGLVGPNGAGKTTLFMMILGKIEPSNGSIQINKNIRIGYLPQEASFKSDAPLLLEVIEGDEKIMQLNQEKQTLEANNQAGTARYGEILHQLEFLGYFDLEHKAKKILMGLGFKESDLYRPLSQMSGGWQMRALLAKLLTCYYDLLLLDEPVNHLDLGAALWLKDYLANFKGAFIMISHDKDFLNDVTNYTLILENAAFTKVRGNYEDYQKAVSERRNHLLKQFKEQEKKREQLKMFISRFHAQPNKAAQVRAKKKQLERMETIIVPENRRESIRTFHFPVAARSGYRGITLKQISKSYADTQVYKNLDFEVLRGEKAVLVGENGAGKSTLLKILAAVIPIDSGSRIFGHNVEVGYFSQARMDILNPRNTVLEEALGASAGRLSAEEVRTVLGAFFFIGDDAFKSVSVLSGGEKSRLNLAKFLVNPPNFLLLDEPTTHLDIDAVEALVKALTEYEGTLVFISHDIHFVRSVANVVFEVKDGTVRKFFGNFDYYLKKQKDEVYIEEASQKKSAKKIKVFSQELSKEEQVQVKQEKEKKRKEHNAEIAKRIKKLKKEKERLEIGFYVKKRILSDPHSLRSEERVKDAELEICAIEKKSAKIDEKINELKQLFIQSGG